MQTEIAAIDNVKIYKYREIRQATDDFSAENKIGEGGFGSVYKVNETTRLLNLLFHIFSSSFLIFGKQISMPRAVLKMESSRLSKSSRLSQDKV